jgi:hypothetical protein
MSHFVEVVLSRLGPIEDGELACVVRAAEDLEKKGWLPEEAVAKLRWLEHVDPAIPEDVALRHMRAADERVLLRLRQMRAR